MTKDGKHKVVAWNRFFELMMCTDALRVL